MPHPPQQKKTVYIFLDFEMYEIAISDILSIESEPDGSLATLELKNEFIPTYIIVFATDASLLIEAVQPITIYLTDDLDQRVPVQHADVS